MPSNVSVCHLKITLILLSITIQAQNIEELVKIIFSISHSNDSASFQKKNYYDSWELAPECVKAPQRWFKGQWLANAGTQ